MNVYLYGITRRPNGSRAPDLGRGVGHPPAQVRLLGCGDLAAALSQVDDAQIGEAAGVRALRRDMTAHTDVLNRLMAVATVLPARFGIVLPDEQTLVNEVLQPHHQRLLDDLERLHGTVELTLRADYVEEQILQEIAGQQPQLVGAGQRGAASTYQDRIETGRRIASMIRLRREQDAQRLLERLSPLAVDVSVSEPSSDMSVFRGSFLIRNKDLSRFDRELDRIGAEAGSRMKLACVGPLPPFSFVDLQIRPCG